MFNSATYNSIEHNAFSSYMALLKSAAGELILSTGAIGSIALYNYDRDTILAAGMSQIIMQTNDNGLELSTDNETVILR